MLRLEFLFLMQIAVGILLLILLHKMSRVKKQLDEITREVENYVAFVTEDPEEEKQGQAISMEDQNSLIQAVLGEYFP